MRFGREVTDDELMAEIKYIEFVDIDDEFREMKTDILYFCMCKCVTKLVFLIW
jgi:hypothetical protein